MAREGSASRAMWVVGAALLAGERRIEGPLMTDGCGAAWSYELKIVRWRKETAQWEALEEAFAQKPSGGTSRTTLAHMRGLRSYLEQQGARIRIVNML